MSARRPGSRGPCWDARATCGSVPGATPGRAGGGAASGGGGGEACPTASHAEVRTDVKVYPYKVVEAGAQVNAYIVWESGGSRTLFGPEGGQGIANGDGSPELAGRG